MVLAVYDEGLAMGIVEGIRSCFPKMEVSYFTDCWKDAATMEFDGERVFGVVFENFHHRKKDRTVFFNLMDELESSGHAYHALEER